MNSKYNKLMRKCITLAKKGEGRVSPNPLVGCIIFDDDFNIISEGFHKKYGENHAERNAILNSKKSVKGKNLIVNLEPCSHYGKTPPCCDLIIKKGIKKVIIGMIDPNPIVSGNGIEKLKNAGIEVITGVLEKECRLLNEIFIKNQTQNKPFITIKTAATLDGKIATEKGNSKWITDEFSRYQVHKLRNKYDAILTSSATVIADNPQMTCRIRKGRNPIRIVADTHLKTNPDKKIYENNGAKIYLVTSKEKYKEAIKKFPSHIEIIPCPLKNSHIDIKKMIEILYNKGIRSIMTESGGIFNNAVIQSGQADCLIQFIAPKILSDKNGLSFAYGMNRDEISKCNSLIFQSTKLLKNDIIIVSYFQ